MTSKTEESAVAATLPISKNEAKKLAKKAEKAAKKQPPPFQAAGAGTSSSTAPDSATAPSTAAAPTDPCTTTAATATTYMIQTKPLLTLVVPPTKASDEEEQDLDLFKVIWAWQHYHNKGNDNDHPNLEVISGPELELVYNNHDNDETIRIRRGNNMVRALAASASKSSYASLHNELLQDDWCEWEQRTADCFHTSTNGKDAALEHLAQGLTKAHHSLSHLAGDAFGWADICILSSLSILRQKSNEIKFPLAVETYLSAHASAIESARQGVMEARQQAAKASSNNNQSTSSSSSSLSLLHTLHALFRDAIQSLYPNVSLSSLPTYYVSKTSHKQGDYQCSAAMPLASLLKQQQQQSAKEIAAALLAAVQDNVILTNLSVQGPGFVCFQISSSYLTANINQLLLDQKLPMPRQQQDDPKICVVDFSSPNIAKEMHVGHLRSTILGESVCRILEACGKTVHRVNHVGDWGTQFGMLIQYMQETVVMNDLPPDQQQEQPNISDLTAFYKAAKARFDEDADFKTKSQLNVVKLQSGQDAECNRIWQLLCDISRREFEKVYTRLDVTLEECGESFYNDKIPNVLAEFEAANLLEVDAGAKVVRIVSEQQQYPVPLMLQKSDGGFGYDSTDMAALKYRLQELNASRIIVLTDASQEVHFQMVNKAGHMIGWVDKNQKLEHIGFGAVMGDDGKRFKTRSGDTVRLVDLLDEAVSRMEAQLRERIAQGKANITLDEVHTVAEAIGYGALKYFDLRRNPKSNYKFSYDEMLDTKGDTAVYLLYARVRLESIIAKAKKEHNVDVEELLRNSSNNEEPMIVLGHEVERCLALSLATFPDVMEQTLEDLYPCHICEYVYKVANAATDFVTQCKVLGSPEMKSRLLLCQVTTMAIHQCFDLLGIRHVKRI